MAQSKRAASTAPTTSHTLTDNIIISECKAFLQALFPEETLSNGEPAFIEIRLLQTDTLPNTSFMKLTNISEDNLARFLRKAKNPARNVYFGVGARTNKKSGKKQDVGYISTLWLDIDEKDGTPKDEALKLLREWIHKPSYIIDSGHGIHAYWVLREPVEPSEFSRVEAVNRALAHKFNGDMSVVDIARIMRVPGSLNVKEKPFLPVTILETNPFRYELDDLEEVLPHEEPTIKEYKLSGEKSNGNGIKPGNFSIETIEKAIDECAFLKHCRDDAKTLREVEWYEMITNLVAMGADDSKIHELSSPYPGYSKRETDEKIKHARLDAPGPHTCVNIEEHFEGCKTCHWRANGVKSPSGIAYGLKSQPTFVGNDSELIFRPAMKEKGLDRAQAAVNLVKSSAFRYWIDSRLENFWAWNGKHFEEVTDLSTMRRIQELSRKEDVVLNDYQLSSITKIVKTLSEVSEIPEEKPSIPLTNGILKINQSKNPKGLLSEVSFELVKHQPQYGNKHVLNVAYDPAAKAPTFDRFLKSLNLDQNDVALLQEFAGYMLVPAEVLNYHKCLILWGAGANGKSTFTNMLIEMLGRSNCATLRVDEMNGFKLSTMKGKIANIGTEISSSGKFIETHNFKAAISGEPITIDEKYKTPRTYKLRAKHLFSVNDIPNIADFSNGFIRRLLIIKFERIFNTSEQDPHLGHKLEKELPGILNWALEGLRRLLLNDGIFSEENSWALIREHYVDTDPIMLFAEDKLEIGKHTLDDFIFNCDLYSAYTTWCVSSGIRPKSKAHFGRDFQEKVPQLNRKYNGLIQPCRNLTGESFEGYKQKSRGFLGLKFQNNTPLKKADLY